MKFFKAANLSILGLIGSIGVAHAVPIGYSVDTASDTLYSIDLGTGMGTAVGTGLGMGFTDVEGLAFQPGTGILFGLNDSSDELVTIDTLTGLATVVGALGFNFSEAGLGFLPDGTLYASGDLGDNGVYTVNPLTGAATFLSDAGPDVAGLAANAAGSLFGVSDDCSGGDCLTSVNLTTGVTTQIGNLGNNLNVDEAGLAFDSAGTLWMLDQDLNSVYTIDTTTGIATAGMALNPDLSFEGLAIRSVVTVPEPGTLALFGLGLVGMGLARRRKRS